MLQEEWTSIELKEETIWQILFLVYKFITDASITIDNILKINVEVCVLCINSWKRAINV